MAATASGIQVLRAYQGDHCLVDGALSTRTLSCLRGSRSFVDLFFVCLLGGFNTQGLGSTKTYLATVAHPLKAGSVKSKSNATLELMLGSCSCSTSTSSQEDKMRNTTARGRALGNPLPGPTAPTTTAQQRQRVSVRNCWSLLFGIPYAISIHIYRSKSPGLRGLYSWQAKAGSHNRRWVFDLTPGA